MKKEKMREENYREHKEVNVNLDELFARVVIDYNLRKVLGYFKVEMGYEDNNYILETNKGKYFVKIFGGYRDLDECKRYLEILKRAEKGGVRMPKLFELNNKALYQFRDVNLAVFEYIDGKTFYELDRKPTEEEAREILMQAAKINLITDYKPEFVYDEWGIVNILDQYRAVEPHLSKEEKEKIAPLIVQFKGVDLSELPKALVHGDIITTNVMKGEDGEIHIIDFACANYLPRIVELAVLGCNILVEYEPGYILEEYEKHLKLDAQERKLFSMFLNLAHAMHVIGSVRERDIYKNGSDENDYWLNQGKKGLGIV